MLPLAIHAHQTCLPLLADFPQRRIDINPFHTTTAGHWGHIDAATLARDYPRSHGLPLLLFFDTHTIANARITSLNAWPGEVYLFVGDTQHGSEKGFRDLIALAEQPEISKLYFVNNPQHAHWFRTVRTACKKFLFYPLGLGNCDLWPDVNRGKEWAESVVHVGNVSPAHPRRKRLHDFFYDHDHNQRIAWLRTNSYQEANRLYTNSLAALNVSLNSDLSFRLYEVMASGGICISDRLGRVQRDHFMFRDSPRFFEFDTKENLLALVKELRSTNEKPPCAIADAYQPDRSLNALDISIPIADVRSSYWCAVESHHGSRLTRYLMARDMHKDLEFPCLTISVETDEEMDHFLDLLDLPRLLLTVCVSSNRIDHVKAILCNFPDSKVRVLEIQ